MPSNILFILIDDMGWADLTCYGSSFYETPRLDALARRGLRFTDAYASCPVCSPTRASVMTGRYPARVGITNWIPGNPWGKLMGVPYFHELPRTERTIAQELQAAGYATYHVGKWHLGDTGHGPLDFGFDVNIGGCHKGSPSSYFSPYQNPTLPDGPPGEYLTDRLTTEAIGLLQRHGPGGDQHGKPFFLNLWHYAVHTPIQSPPDLVEKYKAKAKRLGLDQQQAIVAGEHFPGLHKARQRIERRQFQSDAPYAAMMENLDTNLGRTFDALEQLGLLEDTLIVFTSDNGGLSTAEGSPTCNKPLLEGKGWMYDGGNRVCLLAAGPGVRAGATCDEPVTSTDFFPTFLDAAGLPLKPDLHVDGVSLTPLLSGEGQLQRDAIFWHYPHYSNQGDAPSCAVRAGEFKLVEHFEDGRLELFNLRHDIGETQNLADTMPDVTRRLHGMLVAWRDEVGAKIPEPNPDYEAMLAQARPAPDMMGRIPGDDR